MTAAAEARYGIRIHGLSAAPRIPIRSVVGSALRQDKAEAMSRYRKNTPLTTALYPVP